jgi:hypothetical protein
MVGGAEFGALIPDGLAGLSRFFATGHDGKVSSTIFGSLVVNVTICEAACDNREE